MSLQDVPMGVPICRWRQVLLNARWIALPSSTKEWWLEIGYPFAVQIITTACVQFQMSWLLIPLATQFSLSNRLRSSGAILGFIFIIVTPANQPTNQSTSGVISCVVEKGHGKQNRLVNADSSGRTILLLSAQCRRCSEWRRPITHFESYFEYHTCIPRVHGTK